MTHRLRRENIDTLMLLYGHLVTMGGLLWMVAWRPWGDVSKISGCKVAVWLPIYLPATSQTATSLHSRVEVTDYDEVVAASPYGGLVMSRKQGPHMVAW